MAAMKLLLLLSVFAATAYTGSSSEGLCYSCTYPDTLECKHPDRYRSSRTVACREQCYKYVTEDDNGREKIQRGCGSTRSGKSCAEGSAGLEGLVVASCCTGDKCNGAVHHVTSLGVLLLVAAVAKYFF